MIHFNSQYIAQDLHLRGGVVSLAPVESPEILMTGTSLMSSALLDDLRARGLIFQIAGEDHLSGWLDGGMRTLYCGFDPTADSLHIGSLVPLLMLRRFQLAGAQTIGIGRRCYRFDR